MEFVKKNSTAHNILTELCTNKKHLSSVIYYRLKTFNEKVLEKGKLDEAGNPKLYEILEGLEKKVDQLVIAEFFENHGNNLQFIETIKEIYNDLKNIIEFAAQKKIIIPPVMSIDIYEKIDLCVNKIKADFKTNKQNYDKTVYEKITSELNFIFWMTYSKQNSMKSCDFIYNLMEFTNEFYQGIKYNEKNIIDIKDKVDTNNNKILTDNNLDEFFYEIFEEFISNKEIERSIFFILFN